MVEGEQLVVPRWLVALTMKVPDLQGAPLSSVKTDWQRNVLSSAGHSKCIQPKSHLPPSPSCHGGPKRSPHSRGSCPGTSPAVSACNTQAIEKFSSKISAESPAPHFPEGSIRLPSQIQCAPIWTALSGKTSSPWSPWTPDSKGEEGIGIIEAHARAEPRYWLRSQPWRSRYSNASKPGPQNRQSIAWREARPLTDSPTRAFTPDRRV